MSISRQYSRHFECRISRHVLWTFCWRHLFLELAGVLFTRRQSILQGIWMAHTNRNGNNRNQWSLLLTLTVLHNAYAPTATETMETNDRLYWRWFRRQHFPVIIDVKYDANIFFFLCMSNYTSKSQILTWNNMSDSLDVFLTGGVKEVS